MNSPSEKQPDSPPVPALDVPNEKPLVGERAVQFADDVLRLVRLTNSMGLPSGPVADTVAARSALIALAVKYNMPGSEIVDASRLIAWRIKEGK